MWQGWGGVNWWWSDPPITPQTTDHFHYIENMCVWYVIERQIVASRVPPTAAAGGPSGPAWHTAHPPNATNEQNAKLSDRNRIELKIAPGEVIEWKLKKVRQCQSRNQFIHHSMIIAFAFSIIITSNQLLMVGERKKVIGEMKNDGREERPPPPIQKKNDFWNERKWGGGRMSQPWSVIR